MGIPRLSLLLATLLLLLTACSGSSGIDVASLELTDAYVVQAEGQLMALAPDASRAAFQSDDGVCVVALDPDGDQDCVPFEAAIWTRGARFTPDGRSLLFTEDGPRLLNDPDIWRLDVEDLSLTNLTDDGTEEFDGGDFDIAPVVVDGDVMFFRSGEARVTSLTRVPLDGGDAEEVAQVFDLPVTVVDRPVVTDDGLLVGPTIGGGPEAEERNGVWRIDPSSGEPTLLVRTAELQADVLEDRPGQVMWPVGELDDGRVLVALPEIAGIRGAEPDVPFYGLLDVEGASLETLLDVGAHNGPDAVAVSPDGGALAWIHDTAPRPDDNQVQLVVRDADGDPRVLSDDLVAGIDGLEDGTPPAGVVFNLPPMVWTEENVLVVGLFNGGVLVLELAS